MKHIACERDFDNENFWSYMIPPSYSIDLKIVSFHCERDFYFFEIIRLVINRCYIFILTVLASISLLFPCKEGAGLST